ncbi:MAG: S-layer protein [Thermofilaceae archaeon]
MENSVYALIETDSGRLKGYVKEIKDSNVMKAIAHPLRLKLLRALAEGPQYPLELAKTLKVNEQLVYYHMSRLKKTGLVKEIGIDRKRGALAVKYELAAEGFAVIFREHGVGEHLTVLPQLIAELFKEDKPVYMVLSSPEPHGPFRSRGRDHHLAAHIAYLIGAAYGSKARLNVVLDTDHNVDLTNANLLLLGGPAVNMVTASVNDKLPIRFDLSRGNLIVSMLSKREYGDENCAVIELLENPLGTGRILLIAGLHLSGTKAAVSALFKRGSDLSKPNSSDRRTIAHVVEGVDSDGDGEPDDAVILE